MNAIEVECLQHPVTDERLLAWNLEDGSVYYEVEDDLSAGEQAEAPADITDWVPCYSQSDIHTITPRIERRHSIPADLLDVINEGFNAASEIIVGPAEPTSINVRVTQIDQRGGILAQAAPTAIWRSTRTTARGFIEIDLADLITGDADESVVLHELLHVLGFANFPGLPFAEFVDRDETGTLVFTGPNATAVWQDLGGAGSPPLHEPDGGSHWSEQALTTELQTPYSDGEDNTLSTLTLAALTDIGYKVSISAANRFNLRNALSAELCESCSIGRA